MARAYGLGGGGLGTVGVGQQASGISMLTSAAKLEEERQRKNQQIELANRNANRQIGSTVGAAAGMAVGASYGSAGGPWGALIGGVIGGLAGGAF